MSADKKKRITYAEGIRQGFRHLLGNYPQCFAIGQGLWSPWYVGATMTDLDKEFGTERIIDTPVSETACTGAAIGAALCGYRPIVIHPRMDFMVLASDAIVNQAAKWAHMLGGGASPAVTIRGIINRGGEQGAQHSQALHAWYAHVPGLRVVMPATPQDARDLLIASVLCDHPVLYIDNRWLYEREQAVGPIDPRPLEAERAVLRRDGGDVTLVGSGYAAWLCEQAAELLAADGISAAVVDLRILNPFDATAAALSVARTGRLVAVDDGWRNCGMAGEVVARVMESIDPGCLKARPVRITLPSAPAPTSKALEAGYYPGVDDVVAAALSAVDRPAPAVVETREAV
jgi:acetoin:2,6-dichlorophenolindophenol oxidoreductase subunit beta